jgi:hypothetical protein
MLERQRHIYSGQPSLEAVSRMGGPHREDAYDDPIDGSPQWEWLLALEDGGK